jgi:hypothetical protein
MEQLEFILAILSSVTALTGVLLGWLLAKMTEKERLKVQEIRNELEKTYGPLYSIVSKPEEMVKIDGGEEHRVAISEMEKHELDRILMSYPHMLPYEIVVLWRTQIKNLESFRTSTQIKMNDHSFLEHPIYSTRLVRIEWFGIPLEFRDKITKEYEQRLEEYYQMTGRAKTTKTLPKSAGI